MATNINHHGVKTSLLGFISLACLLVYWPALEHLVERWWAEPEYGHGFLLAGCALYIFWQQRRSLAGNGGYRYLCLIPLFSAIILYWVGTLAALYLALQLSLIAMLLAIGLASFGLASLRVLGFPLILLTLSIPLPYFIEAQLTAKLQLVSSSLAVKIIQAMGMPVFLQGNVIDLGVIQLEVVEACSGLRYLYPLISLGVLVSYFYRAPWWRRIIVICSTVPLTIVMNSARIAATAWLVERYGLAAAEGFFHDFEGLVIFFVCMMILALEITLIEAVCTRRRLWQVLDFDVHPNDTVVAKHELSSSYPQRKPLLVVLFVLGGVYAWSVFEGLRVRIEPVANIAYFPLQWGSWHGQIVDMDEYKLQQLQVDDYLLANFYRPQDQVPVNVYVAFYAHQSAGVSPHSPKVCMPGGGWAINRFEEVDAGSFRVNEALIERQGERQLVHYWFVERGVPMVNEYRRKWHLLQDAMLSGRTDGALVRITTPVLPDEQVAAARERLQALERRVAEPILSYLPAD